MQFEKKPVILVTGANGQLGNEFRQLASQQDNYEFLFTTRDTLDITDQHEVMRIFQKFRPDFCINCAAYTAVDKAEEEQTKAFAVNSEAVRFIVNACHLYTCKLIHFSTDYVYHSIKDRPIKETDECDPQGLYGKSKRAGELILEYSNIEWICLRVSWLYSAFNHNFVKTMLRLGEDRSALNVVNDQIGAPTYARDLATDVMSILAKDNFNKYTGHYNYSNGGQTNWAAFAKEIFKQRSLPCKVSGISTQDYGAAAPRPLWSVMDKTKILDNFAISPRDWKEALRDCLALIA